MINAPSHEKKVLSSKMVNNLTNNNKTNKHLSPQIIEHEQDHQYGVGNSGPG